MVHKEGQWQTLKSLSKGHVLGMPDRRSDASLSISANFITNLYGKISGLILACMRTFGTLSNLPKTTLLVSDQVRVQGYIPSLDLL